MIFKKEVECAPESTLKELQTERLKSIVAKVYERVPHYKKEFDRIGLKPSHIKSLNDITKLPFTRKTHLRDNYPFGMFAEPMSNIVEIHASSGTTGNPTVVAYTKKDIELWSDVMARSLACIGGTSEDIIQNAYGYGLFTGGLGVHYGALALGAAVIPMSSGVTKRQLKIMMDFGATLITCTPSYMIHMGEEAQESGFDFKKCKLKAGAFGAEPWSDQMRNSIESLWNLKACDIYGLSEIIGPGVAMECLGQNGLHLFSDVFYPEIINSETEQPVEPGEQGELTITTLTKEAIPLIRYRTGDIVKINYEPCKHCGRTSPRISKILGRTDDMLIIRGINVFPSQIESVLLSIPEVSPHYLIVVNRRGALDELEIQVEVGEKMFSDEVRKLEQIEQKIREEMQSVLALQVEVKLVEPKTIERSMGKAKRVIDNRKI